MSRLAELLGLEDSKRYRYEDYYNDFTFIINGSDLQVYEWDRICDGIRERNNFGHDYWLLINYPEKITELHHKWTATEIENAKAIKQLYPTAATIKRDDSLWGSTGVLAPKVGDKPIEMLTSLNDVVFPSLVDGEEVELNDIINEGKLR